MITWANQRLFTIGSLFFDLFLGARTLWDYLTFKWKIDTQKKIWFDFYVFFFFFTAGNGHKSQSKAVHNWKPSPICFAELKIRRVDGR